MNPIFFQPPPLKASRPEPPAAERSKKIKNYHQPPPTNSSAYTSTLSQELAVG